MEEVIMESIKQWFQDWSDACEYAKECAPDLSFLSFTAPQEPYSALASIAAACFLIWWWNERQFKRTRNRQRKAETAGAVRSAGLPRTRDQTRSVGLQPRKQAA
jgi:hypothetical protein